MNMQDTADHLCEQWAADIWNVKEGQETFTDDELLPHAMPAPEPAFIRKAAATSPRRTGFGCDSLHPRWCQWLSDAGLRHLAAVMVAMEEVGRQPAALVAIIVFLAKREGGVRPIGLLAGFLRIWTRTRRLYMQQWELANDRQFFAAAAGRSAEHTVWAQSLWQE